MEMGDKGGRELRMDGENIGGKDLFAILVGTWSDSVRISWGSQP